MTIPEYNSFRQQIEERYRGDMAALERVFYIINGINPPGSVVQLAKPSEFRQREMAGRQRELGEPLSPAAEAVKKRLGNGWARKRAAKDGQSDWEALSQEMKDFYTNGGKHYEKPA